MRRTRYIIGASVLSAVLSLSGCYFFPAEEEDAGQTEQTVEAVCRVIVEGSEATATPEATARADSDDNDTSSSRSGSSNSSSGQSSSTPAPVRTSTPSSTSTPGSTSAPASSTAPAPVDENPGDDTGDDSGGDSGDDSAGIIAGVANTSSSPLPYAFAVFSSVTAMVFVPLIPVSNILISSLASVPLPEIS